MNDTPVLIIFLISDLGFMILFDLEILSVFQNFYDPKEI
jgi:hypothetical protein